MFINIAYFRVIFIIPQNCITYKAVQNKKRLSKKSTVCDDMLFTHRFQGNITS